MKKNEKNAWKSITVIAVVLTVLAIAMAGTASAKSLYVNKDINANSPISAYDIQPAPTYLVWQQTSAPTRYGGAGLAIDTDSETLFVTFETSGTLDMVDAKTLNIIGNVTAPGATNLAGIVVDQDKQKVYTNNRGASSIYVYSWNATTKTLTLDGTQSLSGVSQAYGIALDEVNDLLYVGDLTTTVKIFNTADWSSAGNFTVSQKVMGIAVDVANGFVYTGNAYPGYGSLGNLSKYDLNTNIETTVNITTLSGGVSTDNVVGLAVDPATGLLYVTTGNQGVGGSDRILAFDSNLNMLYNTSDIGNPTGICVPGKEISYNPLNLTKDDGLADDECVAVGGSVTYDLCYDNTGNAYNVSNVTIVDNLPANASFASATGGGTYDSSAHTVIWNIGTLLAGAAQQCVQLVVQVDSTATPGSTITNSATIDSDETPPTTVNEITDVCLNQPPDASGTYPSISCLWPPNHKFVDITIEGVTDPDGDNVTITITNITSDEPTATIEGAGGDKHAPDASGVGTDTASLRAERSGTGNGRVYEITFVASDGIAETEGSVTVCVPHDPRKGTCECIDDGQDYDATEIN